MEINLLSGRLRRGLTWLGERRGLTPSSRCCVDGVEDDGRRQHERASLISTRADGAARQISGETPRRAPRLGPPARGLARVTFPFVNPRRDAVADRHCGEDVREASKDNAVKIRPE